MNLWYKIKPWIGTVGGLAALTGFFLPFASGQSLFDVLRNDPLPFFTPLLALLIVLAMVLHARGYFSAACCLALGLFTLWLFFLGLILWVFTPAALGSLEPGAYLLPAGLLAMALCPA